jgi:hypothetical protein
MNATIHLDETARFAAMPGYAPVGREERRGNDLALWLYKGALTYVQHIPMEDRKTLLAHRLHSDGPHPLEEGHSAGVERRGESND